MRLGYFVPEFPSQTHAFFWDEIQTLRRMDDEVIIISTRRPPPDVCRHHFAKEAADETHYIYPPSIKDLGLHRTHIKSFPRAFEYLHSLRKSELSSRIKQYGLLVCAFGLARWSARQKIAHIHGHSCADTAHILAMSFALGGPSYSLTLHGDLDVYGTDHQAKLRNAKFVCVVGQHLRHQLIARARIGDSRIVNTFMGVDTKKLVGRRIQRMSEPGKLHVVTVARLNRAKGHAHCLAAIHVALQHGADIHYTITGDGPHREQIISEVVRLGLQDRVTFTGTLSHDEVFDLLLRCDAFVLPSVGLGEAWPVSIMEAMTAGLPVIASNIGATSEMITNEHDGFLVSQADEARLSKCLVALAFDLELRAKIGATARQTAVSRFDVNHTTNKLRETLHKSIIATRMIGQ